MCSFDIINYYSTYWVNWRTYTLNTTANKAKFVLQQNKEYEVQILHTSFNFAKNASCISPHAKYNAEKKLNTVPRPWQLQLLRWNLLWELAHKQTHRHQKAGNNNRKSHDNRFNVGRPPPINNSFFHDLPSRLIMHYVLFRLLMAWLCLYGNWETS